MRVEIEHTDLIGRAFRDVVRAAGVDPDNELVKSISVDYSKSVIEVYVLGTDGRPKLTKGGELETRFVVGPTIDYNWNVE